MSKNKRQNNLITKQNLKRERRWTDALITRLLPQPDQTRRNPVYQNAAPMCLYDVQRITKIENTAEFQDAFEKAAQRKQAAQLATEEKRSRTFELVESLSLPKLPSLSKNQLKARAVKHYNQLWTDRLEDKRASVEDSPEFLNRIAVNYVRHELTQYENQLEEILGHVGAAEARLSIAEKVLDAIAETYPWLAEECCRWPAPSFCTRGYESTG